MYPENWAKGPPCHSVVVGGDAAAAAAVAGVDPSVVVVVVRQRPSTRRARLRASRFPRLVAARNMNRTAVQRSCLA